MGSDFGLFTGTPWQLDVIEAENMTYKARAIKTPGGGSTVTVR
jgi:hypothetical protein